MNKNAAALFAAILAGFVFNRGHEYSPLIPYLLMIMLFFPFLTVTRPHDGRVFRHALILFLAMVGLGLLGYVSLRFWDREMAVIAFLLATTPTATAAPVVIGMLKKNVDYVVTAVVVTNVSVSLYLPVALGWILPQPTGVSVFSMAVSTLAVVLIPLAAAQSVKRVVPSFAGKLAAFSQIPFVVWLIVLYLASAKASAHLYASPAPLRLLSEIAALALLLCVVNFMLGRYLGGERYAKEGSQALGQKNNMFMTWLALEYVSPTAALGPVCYLVFQNLYNSYLLGRSRQS